MLDHLQINSGLYVVRLSSTVTCIRKSTNYPNSELRAMKNAYCKKHRISLDTLKQEATCFFTVF